MGSGSTRGWSGTAPPVIPRSLLPPKTRERDAAASCPSQSPNHAPFPRFGGQKGIGGDRGIPNKQLDKNSADPAAFPVGCGDAQREFKEVFLFLFSRTQAVASLRARRRNPVCTKPQARLEGQRPRRKHRTTHFKKSLRSPGVMYSLSASIHNTVTYCKKVAFGVVPLRNNLHSGGAGASSRPSVRPSVPSGRAAQCRWQVCRRDASAGPCSRCRRHASPSEHGQRWKSSRPCVPFRRCRVHTCPSRSTGLQILDQKWRAQHSPAAQSEERRQKSPSSPAWGQRGGMLRRTGTRWGHWGH